MTDSVHSRSHATLIGAGAIVVWSSLAVLTAISGTMPPFQLAAITFAIGGGVGAVAMMLRPGAARALKQPLPVWLLGVGGLFGYHALYFFALRLCPPAEASLVNYLWPLLIVVLSAALPGERLRWYHVAGALLGLVGTTVLIFGKGELGFAMKDLPGYLAAGVAAVTWAVYSVASRRFPHVPTDAVAGFCLITALLAAACHMLFETTAWPQDWRQWAAIVGLGLGPVGLAFYAWDHAMKHGEIRLLGVLSYGAPILSTLLLVGFGVATPSTTLALACGLIVAGALIASKDLLLKPGA